MSFASGFAQGRGIVNDAYDRMLKEQEMEIRKAVADREAKRFGWESADRDAVDSAIRGYTGLEANGVVATNKTGISDQGLAALNSSGGRGLVTETMRLANEEAAMLGQQPQYQMPAEGGPQYTTRAATGLERNSALAKIAAAKRDVNGLRDLDKERKVLEEDDLIAKAEFKPEDIQWLNKNHKRLTARELRDGKGKATGYRVTDIDDDGNAKDYELSKADGKKLAGALAIMQSNPTRALQLIEGIDKSLAEMIAKENGLVTESTRTGNTAAHYQNADANAAARLDIDRKRLGLEGERVRNERERIGQADWKIIGHTSDNKGLLYFNERTRQTETRPLPPGVDASNIYQRITGARGTGTGTGLEKLPEDGTRHRDSKGNVYTYTEGVPLLDGGVAPSQQSAFYTKAGFPPQAERDIEWLPGGRHIRLRGGDEVYDMANKDDVNAVRTAITRAANRQVEGAEASARGAGLMDPRDAAARRGPTYIDRYTIPSPLERAYNLTPR